MLDSIQLRNFKSLRNTGEISLAPVTLLCGANSSGKSSLIQALLVIKQSLENPSFEEPLILNGSWVALGEFDDVRTFSSNADEPIGFGFSVSSASWKAIRGWGSDLQTPSAIHTQNWRRFYRRPVRGSDAGFVTSVSLTMDRVRGEHGLSNVLGSTAVTIRNEDQLIPSYEIMVERDPELVPKLSKKYVMNGDFSQIYGDSLYAVKHLVGQEERPQACLMRYFLPVTGLYTDKGLSVVDEFITALNANWDQANVVPFNSLRRRKDIVVREFRSNLRQWVEAGSCFSTSVTMALDGTPLEYRELIQQILPTPLEHWEDKLKQAQKKPLLQAEPLNATLHLETDGGVIDFDDALNDLTQFFTGNLLYLGPLRDEPRAFYHRLGSSDPTYVGQRGENTAFVLKHHGNRPVVYIEPPTTDSGWNPSAGRKRSEPLKRAVVKWLRYLGVAQDIDVQELGKIGLTMKADLVGGKKVDLTNVGVGISQVLPLLVLGLVSPLGSTLLLEQPELHLHPYVQSRLGDFFASLTAVGKQVIAETHSEHLIHRMRLYIAKGYLHLKRDLAIYFFSRPGNSEASEIQPINIGRYGEVRHWPVGFFDETTKQLAAIMDAALERAESEESEEE